MIRLKRFVLFMSLILTVGFVAELSLASLVRASTPLHFAEQPDRFSLNGSFTSSPRLSTTLVITTSPLIDEVHTANHRPSKYQRLNLKTPSRAVQALDCNPTNGSGGLGVGTHDTVIAGQPATIIVGDGYVPTEPTYLALYLHGDEGGYDFHTHPSNAINKFVNDQNWIYVAPQVYKATDGDYYPWDGRGGGSIVANANLLQDVLDFMFANYNVCRDIMFGGSVSGGSWFWDIYFYPQHGGTYPAFMNLVCGAGGVSADRNFWGSYDKLVTLSMDANIKARSEFKYTIGTNDFLYDRALISVPSYTDLGFSVIPDYLDGVSHCLTGATMSSSEKIRAYWETKFNSLNTLTIDKSVSTNLIAPGNVLTYTIVAKVSGSTADNVVIMDTVPANTRFLWASDEGTASGIEASSLITWSIDTSLVAEQPITRTFVVTVNDGLSHGLAITNVAHISASTLLVKQASNQVNTLVNAPTSISYIPMIIKSNEN